jgi:hypothetical protein
MLQFDTVVVQSSALRLFKQSCLNLFKYRGSSAGALNAHRIALSSFAPVLMRIFSDVHASASVCRMMPSTGAARSNWPFKVAMGNKLSL